MEALLEQETARADRIPLAPYLGLAEFRAGGFLRASCELADDQPREPEIYLVA